MKANEITNTYAENVFTIKTMRNYLSKSTYKALMETVLNRSTIDAVIADEVADAMKTWALAKGATHFTHWFQPLTGATAEKHDSFIEPDREGGCMMVFSGKELIQGEPDASSFPSGGLRATFEARGYTAWDPTSPAFIKEGEIGSTLCIPTVFCAYNGEALDEKTPLLKSMDVLSGQICRLAKLFGIKTKGKRAYPTMGAEQEYFLVDKEFYDSRRDLLQTGRTLFGIQPSKHQQMDDHYFGAIKPRVMAFMEDLDRKLWKLGIPSKTRHNEVCPAQFEIAPIFEELNLGIDHNMLTMEILRNTAEEHDFACLLHEKPYAGVNGSGKHNNWSVVGPDDKNWLTPGENPHENAKFLTMICALIMGIDKHAALLRATVASAGNDHRLGANEAPPAIISIFLGEQLYDVIKQLATGAATSSKQGGTIEIGIDSLPKFPRDATDRNRTSPFAFTGNKFEFRAVGSSHNCSQANTILNTIVSEALDDICTSLEAGIKKGEKLNDVLQQILQNIIKKHKRILFNGDNYTDDWKKEAKKRGLPNLTTTPEALKAYTTKETINLFDKYGILSKRELNSRYNTYLEIYEAEIIIEAICAKRIAKNIVIPAVIRYQAELADSINMAKSVLGKVSQIESKKLLSEISKEIETVLTTAAELEKVLKTNKPDKIISVQKKLRTAVDTLETLMDRNSWPLPSYTEMMFVM
jgi:glutamine synthetase